MHETDRVVVVTGGSGGLGREISRRFARGGDRVFVGYHHGADRAQALVDELTGEGCRAFPLAMDLASEASVNGAFDEVEAAAGSADILVNNAAYRPIGPFLSLTDADWQAVLGVCLLGAVRTSRRTLPGMVQQNWGRIA
jgi:NAD(P)-dependent dehydrogenase (short-subunit alcohol dehydrogenase family)